MLSTTPAPVSGAGVVLKIGFVQTRVASVSSNRIQGYCKYSDVECVVRLSAFFRGSIAM